MLKDVTEPIKKDVGDFVDSQLYDMEAFGYAHKKSLVEGIMTLMKRQHEHAVQDLLTQLEREVGGMKIDKVKAIQVLLGETMEYGTAFGDGYKQAKQDVIKLLEKYD